MPLGQPAFLPPTPLDEGHDTVSFTCGKPRLDRWLQRHALANQRLESSRTFVTCLEDDQARIAGYYSLAVASVQHQDAPTAVERGMPPRFPIPAMLLARLAVDVNFRRPVLDARLGEFLLRDALLRTVRVAHDVAIRAMLVDAIDEDAAGFYRRYGFEPSPTDALQLFLPMSRIRASVEAAGL